MRVGAWILCAALAGCAHERSHRVPPKPRNWIDLSAGLVNVEPPRTDVVDDSWVLGIGGGIDFVQGPPDVGFELGAFGSEHDINDGFVDVADHHDDLDIVRFYGGLRATTELGVIPFTAYARGGWFFRSEHDETGSGLGDEAWGTYLGAGLEYMVEPDVRFGPFVMYQRSNDSPVEEWLFGFSARFYVDD
jgi:hypothetical protein